MLKKNITALFILCATFFASGADFVLAQDGTIAAQNSKITAAQMPRATVRILPESVPAEFTQAFDSLLKQGAGKISGGDREVLALTGNYKSAANVTKSISQMETNFRNAGWKYESQGKNNELELFMLSKEDSTRRVVLGFFVPADEILVCALMEVLLPGEKTAAAKTQINQPSSAGSFPVKTDSSAKTVTVDKETQWINVMGNEMPAIPQFSQLAPKPGKVRGYVKDWTGKPLAGAELGVRSSYFAGQYSGAQGKTDANGYYEFVVPKGSAHFYSAGYQIEWGDGVAGLSLHPADGKLDSFVTMDGGVENFVLLPYGITSRENSQQSSHLPSTFYGGAIFLNWYSAEANNDSAPPFAVREGSMLEVTLTPEGKMFDGTAGQTIVIRKILGLSGAFRIHNIPIGRYRIGIKANGKPLKITDNKQYINPMFGMTPGEAIGGASILFVPDGAKASMIGPQFGSWKWISLNISTPE
jgi:hypothetical protein